MDKIIHQAPYFSCQCKYAIVGLPGYHKQTAETLEQKVQKVGNMKEIQSIDFYLTCLAMADKGEKLISNQNLSAFYAPNFEKVGDILVSACAPVYVWGIKISS